MEIDTLSIVLNQITNTLAMLAKDISEVRVQLASGSSNSTLDNMQINHHLEKIENDLTIARNAIEDLKLKENNYIEAIHRKQSDTLTMAHNIETLLNRMEAQIQEEKQKKNKLDYERLHRVAGEVEEAIKILKDKKKEVVNKALIIIVIGVTAGLLNLIFGKSANISEFFKSVLGVFN